ncbi:MAG: GNAT family N-acetyltransferase [Bacteroidia bacterium]
MKIIETERLILRELLTDDDENMFELDSNAEVHKYLGNNPVTTIEQVREVIASVRQQYIKNGIGRWAAIEKSSGNFIGWSGLKFITEPENNQVNFYDVGYRLIPKYWGKGYATESTKAALEYGFTKMNLEEIIGTVNENNKASKRALEKCGLKFIEKFQWKNITCDWMKISKTEWKFLNNKLNVS